MYGTVVDVIRRAACVVSETVYAPGTGLAEHAHRRASVCLVVAGGFTELRGGRSRDHGVGSVVIRPARAEHANRFDVATRCFNIELAAGTARDGDALAELTVRAHAAFATNDCVALDAAIGELAVGLGRVREPAWLCAAREAIRRRFPDVPPLTDLARDVGVHPVHLARGFRAHVGHTIGDEVRRLRVEHACDLLARSHTSLAEIAASAGFADQSHMNRVFGRVLGVTPARYRASAPR